MIDTVPTEDSLFEVVDKTWPAYAECSHGIWLLREGRGAGNRVSSASTTSVPTMGDIVDAEVKMHELGQVPQFVVRGNQPELDRLLEQAGYVLNDPVDILAVGAEKIARYVQANLEVIFTGAPISILREIWALGGVLEPRIGVMQRSSKPNTFILGRTKDRASAAAFASVHKQIAMVHAVEVMPHMRRMGVAESLMRGAAWWALENGATTISCLVTEENSAAQSLYRKMGMEVASHYHYRSPKKEGE